MKKNHLQLLILIIITLFSCTSEQIEEEEEVIEITTSDFRARIDENPQEDQSIGFLDASTNLGEVSYAIKLQIPEGAIYINPNNGELKVLDKKLFNYELNQIISATVIVSNGDVFQELKVTIELNDIREFLPFEIIAGTGNPGYSGDGALAINAELNYPRSMVFDPAGNLIFADEKNNSIRKIDQNGFITTIAGTGISGYSGDGGNATVAKLNNPRGITLDTEGNILIADTGNNVIRKINNGIIQTIAGTGIAGFAGDEGKAEFSQLNSPRGVHVDNKNNIYIADFKNHRVRKINSNGVITTIAGNGDNISAGDGELASTASLEGPYCITSKNENIYIGDISAGRIRKIDPNGVITSILNEDGIHLITSPTAINFGSNNNLFVTDLGGKIYRIDSQEKTHEILTTNELGFIGGFAFDNNANFFYSDSFIGQIKKIKNTEFLGL